MSVRMASTKAKGKDAEKLKEVQNKYELDGFNFQLDQEGNLQALPDSDLDHWPQAVHIDDLPEHPDEKHEHDEDAWDDWNLAWEEVFHEKGDEGFISLLREVAPCLETPLLILCLNYEGEPVAQAWNVQPSGAEVQTLELFAYHPI